MSASAHSSLGASSAYRWMACPGSVKLSAGLPNDSSPYAVEGQCAHLLAEKCLSTNRSAFSWVGETFPEFPEYEIDDEMADAVDLYHQTVLEDCARFGHGQDYSLDIEVRFDLTHIYPGMFGTNDASVYFPEQKHLIVYDYKHGQGIPVEVERNLQMMYYAVGALTGKHNRPIATVELVIVQPRCPHPAGGVRRWVTSPTDIWEFVFDLTENAKRTEAVDAEFLVGDHCGFCPAAANLKCKAIETYALNATGLTSILGEYVVNTPEHYTPAELADALTKADIVKEWARNVMAYAQKQAEKGNTPSGWKLVPKRGMRRWVSENELVARMSKLFLMKREDLCKEPKVMSPAQVESALKARGVSKEGIASAMRDLTETVSSGNTLVPESDKRGAVQPAIFTEFAD